MVFAGCVAAFISAALFSSLCFRCRRAADARSAGLPRAFRRGAARNQADRVAKTPGFLEIERFGRLLARVAVGRGPGEQRPVAVDGRVAVDLELLGEVLEGASRPGFFHGVLTVGLGYLVARPLLPRAGAAYVFVRSGATWLQEAYVKAVQ